MMLHVRDDPFQAEGEEEVGSFARNLLEMNPGEEVITYGKSSYLCQKLSAFFQQEVLIVYHRVQASRGMLFFFLRCFVLLCGAAVSALIRRARSLASP